MAQKTPSNFQPNTSKEEASSVSPPPPSTEKSTEKKKKSLSATLRKLKKPRLMAKLRKSPSSIPIEESKSFQDLQTKYQYLLAEYANYKKQTMKQISDLKKYSGQFFIENLLNSVIDDFDKALQYDLTTKNMSDFKLGIQMIYDRFKKVLLEAGVKEKPALGQPFDPVFFSAVGSAPSQDIAPDHILNVLKKAYLLHDKLIRPGVVIVATSAKVKDEKPKKLL